MSTNVAGSLMAKSDDKKVSGRNDRHHLRNNKYKENAASQKPLLSRDGKISSRLSPLN